MIVVVQRVQNAKCTVNDVITGQIDKGFLLLVGFTDNDNIDTVKKLSYKISGLRIFDDEFGKMNKSLKDIDGSILSISQFTLYGDAKKGNRPSFTKALNPTEAKELYDEFNNELRNYEIKVETGIFGEHMYLDFLNDGPVTLILDSNNL